MPFPPSIQTMFAWAAAMFAAIIMCIPMDAEARSKSRSFSKPRVTQKAPPPRPQATNRVTNNTTVIRETRVIRAAPAQSSGPGIGSMIMGTAVGSMVGTTAGTMLGNHLSQPDAPAPAPEPVQQPMAPVAPAGPVQPMCDARFFNCEPKV